MRQRRKASRSTQRRGLSMLRSERVPYRSSALTYSLALPEPISNQATKECGRGLAANHFVSAESSRAHENHGAEGDTKPERLSLECRLYCHLVRSGRHPTFERIEQRRASKQIRHGVCD